jgi:hypothetical protein
MEKRELLEELVALTANEDVFSVAREINELKVRFDDAIIEMERLDQIAQMEAAEKGEEYEPKDIRSLRKAFNEEYNGFRDKLKVQSDLRNAQENENLKQKNELITRLNKVIQEEENIGSALNAYKEIQETWKTIGDIPRAKRDDIQKEYSRLLEQFFYNLKIYRELKDHDLRRNQQLKEEVISKLASLVASDSIKETEATLKVLQNEWEDIGPVANEEWERLKSEYWGHVKKIYERIHAFYDERRNALQENINKKKEILKEAEELVASIQDFDSVKAWDQATENLLKLQENWRAIGFGPRKENEEIYKSFRGLADTFFASKKAYFEVVQQGFKKIADAKAELVAKAEAIKDSTDWKATADQLVKLQKQWKNVGSAGPKQEQRLWTAFRAACDHFFNARQKNFEDQDKELEVNLEKKLALITEIDAYQPSDDKQQSLADLKSFAANFNALGKVPLKQKDDVYNAFKRGLDKHYGQLKLEGEEKEKILFQARIDTLSASADAGRAFSKERADIRQQIEKIKSEILQLENNLGFFARSKGADALRKEVEAKINGANQRIESLKRKLKLIPNE